MKAIHLIKPVVLLSSLNDMTEKQKAQAIRFLQNEDVIVPGRNGFRFVPIRETKGGLPRTHFYGSEAVCIYREMLGLKDVGIRTIDVNKIFSSAWCWGHVMDILRLLQRVSLRNDRLERLSKFDCPVIILMDEYWKLRNVVESLQNNRECEHPVTDTFEDTDKNGKVTKHTVPYRSLDDIRFDLVTNSCKDEEDE